MLRQRTAHRQYITFTTRRRAILNIYTYMIYIRIESELNDVRAHDGFNDRVTFSKGTIGCVSRTHTSYFD